MQLVKTAKKPVSTPALFAYRDQKKKEEKEPEVEFFRPGADLLKKQIADARVASGKFKVEPGSGIAKRKAAARRTKEIILITCIGGFIFLLLVLIAHVVINIL